MQWLKFIYFDFEGRIDRRTWWLAWSLLLAVEVIANYGLSKLLGNDAPMLDGTWPNLVRSLGDASGWIIATIFFVPNTAMNVKRLRDVGLTARLWWAFVGTFGLATLLSVIPQTGGVDYPHWVPAHLIMFAGILALWLLYTLGFRPSNAAVAKT